jgi:prefoldin subunit 5
MTKDEAISVYKARKSRAKKTCKNLDKKIKELRSM